MTTTAQRGEWVSLFVHTGPGELKPVGILLVNLVTDQLYVAIEDVSEDEGVLAVLKELKVDLLRRADEVGATQVLDWLEDIASNALQLSDRKSIEISDAEDTLGDLRERFIVHRE